MRVEEKGVHAPREWLEPSIQILESRCGRELATVLVLNVLDMGTVFGFYIVDPCKTNSNLQMGQLE
jgi:hypothetical protein